MSRPPVERGVEALAVLHAAADRTPPPCRDDARFIDDTAPLEDLRTVCARCPIFAACEEFRVTARPTGGVWAGKRLQHRRPKGSRKTAPRNLAPLAGSANYGL